MQSVRGLAAFLARFVAGTAMFIALAARSPTVQAETPASQTPAPKEADVEEAKQRFKAGTALFEKGDFKSAIAEFQGGFILTRNPAFLVNIAICQRKMGDSSLALDTFKDFLRRSPDSPRASEVKVLVADLERELGVKLEAPVAQPPLAAPIDTPPPPEPAPPPSAPATAPATAPSGPEDVELLSAHPGRGGQSPSAPEPSLIETARSPIDDQGNSGSGRVWMWVGLGAVVAAVVVGAIVLSGGGEPAPGTLGTIDLR